MRWSGLKKHQRPSAIEKQCSFCFKDDSAAQLLNGPDNVHICHECLEICSNILDNHDERLASKEEVVPIGLECSFCLKGDDQVRYLISGPAVYICNECVSRFREGFGNPEWSV